MTRRGIGFGDHRLGLLALRAPRLIPALLIPYVLPLMLTGALLHLWAAGQLTPAAAPFERADPGLAMSDITFER